jgi:hypothetical protein
VQILKAREILFPQVSIYFTNLGDSSRLRYWQNSIPASGKIFAGQFSLWRLEVIVVQWDESDLSHAQKASQNSHQDKGGSKT